MTLRILDQVVKAIRNWRAVAISTAVGMVPRDLSDFAPAFEHLQMQRAVKLLSHATPAH